jgi:hypothetical protein
MGGAPLSAAVTTQPYEGIAIHSLDLDSTKDAAGEAGLLVSPPLSSKHHAMHAPSVFPWIFLPLIEAAPPLFA